MPTKTELAKAELLKSPNATINEIAHSVGCSNRIVDRAKAELRLEGNFVEPIPVEKVENETRKTHTRPRKTNA